MKPLISKTLTTLLADRAFSFLLGLFLFFCLIFCLYVGFSLHPSNIQVAVHYSAFGQTHYYRQKWYYLINFIVFGILLGIVHGGIAVKLYSQERRPLAVIFLLLSLLLLLITWTFTALILKFAFLS